MILAQNIPRFYFAIMALALLSQSACCGRPEQALNSGILPKASGVHVGLVFVSDYIEENRLGTVIQLEYDQDTGVYKVTTSQGEHVGLLSGYGFTLRLRVEFDENRHKVIELSRVKWSA